MLLLACRASLAQAGASDEGVMDQLAQHQEGFANLNVDAAALKLPRLQVSRRSRHCMLLICRELACQFDPYFRNCKHAVDEHCESWKWAVMLIF